MTSSNGPGVGLVTAEKAIADPAVLEAVRRSVRRSVVEPQSAGRTPGISGGDISSLFFIASQADGIQKWGINPTLRDRQLRLFYPTESVLNSAFSAVIARNQGFDWTLHGPEALVDPTYDLLHSANRGAGWLDFVGKLSTDLYTQDKGAFAEIIRTGDNPDAPVVGIQSLDASRCFHTGDPDTPVIYLDRKGKFHKLRWYQVITFSEMPAPHELLYGLQYCALTRVMRAAQIFRNIQIYREEKTGGRQTRAIHIVGGVESSRITDALNQYEAREDATGNTRFAAGAPIITALNPEFPPSIETLELAALPDNFDAEEAFKEYLTIMALGLLIDFQELAPLPGGGLGTSQQSQILHLKGQGKGPALFMKLFEQKLNYHGVIPRSVTFEFDEIDIEAEETTAKVKLTRAETRQTMRETGEVDEAGARQLAVDDGDIPQELFDEMGQRDVTGKPPRRSTDRVRTENEDRDNPSTSDERMTEDDEKAIVDELLAGTKQAADTSVRDFLVSRLHRAFTTAGDDMRGLGVMDTEERIRVSGLIGKVLHEAEGILDDGALELMQRKLEADDQRVLVAAKERSDDRAGPEQERLDLEEDVAVDVGRGLRDIHANVQRRLDEQGID